MKKQKKSKIPKFRSEKEEAEFWDTHSSTEFLDEFKPAHLDFSKAKRLVSMRLDDKQIEELKKVAAKKGIGYLTMVRMWITERLEQESRKKAA